MISRSSALLPPLCVAMPGRLLRSFRYAPQRGFGIIRLIPLFLVIGLSACQTSPTSFDSVPRKEARRLFLQAAAKQRGGRINDALVLYEEYLDRYPGGEHAVRTLLNKGRLHEKKHEFRDARRAYRLVLDRYPDHPETGRATAGLLHLLYRERRYDQVIRQADQFLRHRENGPHRNRSAGHGPIYLVLGDTYMAQNRPLDAAYFYAKSGEADARNGGKRHPATENRLRTAAGMMEPADLLLLLERVTDDHSRAILLFELGRRQVERKEYEDGLKTLDQFTMLYPYHENRLEAEKLRRDVLDAFDSAGGPRRRRRVGVLLPLSGAFAAFGNKALKGVELAAAAEDTLELLVRDTASAPDRVPELIAELDRANVMALIGPVAASDMAAVEAQDRGIPLLALSQKQDITAAGDMVFRHFITPKQQVNAVVSYAVETMGLTRFAVLYPDERYGHLFMESFADELMTFGVRLLAAEPYDPAQTDFRNQVKLIASAPEIEALFIPDGPKKIALIAPQLRFYGLKNVCLLGTKLWHHPDLLHHARNFVQGAVIPEVFFAESGNREAAAFSTAFQEYYLEVPGFMEALAHDTAEILATVFRRPGILTRWDVRDALLSFQGRLATGFTRFDETGEPRKRMTLLRVDGDRFVELNP